MRPKFVKSGISKAAMILPPNLGMAANFAFNYLMSQADATAAAITEAAGYIAEGGDLYKQLTLLHRKGDDNVFLSISDEYAVSLGAETRTFVLQDCIYPVSYQFQIRMTWQCRGMM
jgi:hypothetical protein